MAKKILFINPSISNTVFGKMRMLALPPMGLGILAALTPEKYEFAIIDENMDPVDFDMDVDLVAVTASTVQAPRAYRIMNEFRNRGIPTIMGGIHASVRTGEAAMFADTVVTGETEDLWHRILDDFDKGKLEKKYHAESFPDLNHMPEIDRSHFSDKYMIQSIQTSRGCPCNCSFCSVTKFNGSRYRFRPIQNVVDEIAGLDEKRLFIADDSIVGLGQAGIDHARKLFENLKGMGKSWGSQVCITIAEHDDLLEAAAKAGANTFYIGFESIEAESLKTMDKSINLRPMISNYRETIKKFHDHGIGVIGGFILGNEADTPDIFDKTIEFVHQTGIDGCQFTLMTPFPGTRYYDQIEREGRLLFTDYPDDWVRYNCYEPVIRPKKMTVHQLMEGWLRVYDETSNLGTALGRGFRTLLSTRSLMNASINTFWNYYNYKAVKSSNFMN